MLKLYPFTINVHLFLRQFKTEDQYTLILSALQDMWQPSLWERALCCRCLWISILPPGEHMPTSCFSFYIYRSKASELLYARRKEHAKNMCLCLCKYVFLYKSCVYMCVYVCLSDALLIWAELPTSPWRVEITDLIYLVSFFDSLNPFLFCRNTPNWESQNWRPWLTPTSWRINGPCFSVNHPISW